MSKVLSKSGRVGVVALLAVLWGVECWLVAGSAGSGRGVDDVLARGPLVAQELDAIPSAVDPWTVLPADPPAELRLSADFLEFDADCQPAFRVTVANTGNTDVFVQIGRLLGGGRRQMLDALRVRVEVPGRTAVEFPWGPYWVGGRVYQALVPLRSGSAHSVRASLADFLRFTGPGTFERFVPGTPARVAFVLLSRAVPEDKTLGIVHPPLWTGELVSPMVDLPACP